MSNKLNSQSQSSDTRVLGNDGKSYSYWRLRTLYATMIGYATFYLVRQNFSMALPGLGAELGYNKTELGWIMTLFALVYGVGKFINGYFSDRSDARYFIAIGLLGSACISIAMGFATWIWVLGLLWSFNGWFQSMGWPPCARLLSHWFSPSELGTKWSIWSASHQIGSAAIVILAGFLVEHFGWRYAFIVPGIIAIFISLFLVNRIRDNPKSLGFPNVEEYKRDENGHIEKEGNITFKEIQDLVFKNKLVWYISIANMFLYIPRMGVLNWAPTFLKEFKGVDLLVAGSQVAVFDVAGLVGGVAAGWFSDKFFQSRRGPVATLYLGLLSFAVLLFWKTPAGYPFIDTIALMLAGFLIAGPQVLVGIALADFASKRAVGIATGLAGIMGYVLGAALSGAGIGKIVDVWGWNGAFIVFITSSICGAFFFCLTWNASPIKHFKILD